MNTLHNMIGILTTSILTAAALYFVGLGVACFLAPSAVERFLLAFARSAPAHYGELGVRILVGASFVSRAPTMVGSELFRVIGWILVCTTLALACMPWTWHRRIAERSVPRALRHLKPIGAVALAAGLALLWAILAEAPSRARSEEIQVTATRSSSWHVP